MAVIFDVDARAFDELAAKVAAIGRDVRPALARALNHTGDKARTQVIRALVKQTGAKYGAVRKALTSRPATAGAPVYRIIAQGPYLSLKEFGARQTGAGVSAAPWGRRRVFAHTFIVPALGGHVFERKGKARLPLRKLWGPALPKELVKDQTKAAFETTVAVELPRRVAHEIEAVLGGKVRGG